jgi:hypothetical protein
MFIETPDQAFGEYSVEAVVLTTGKVYKQTYFGRLVAEKGKIKLIREALDTLAGQLIPRRSSPIGESACVWLR